MSRGVGAISSLREAPPLSTVSQEKNRVVLYVIAFLAILVGSGTFLLGVVCLAGAAPVNVWLLLSVFALASVCSLLGLFSHSPNKSTQSKSVVSKEISCRKPLLLDRCIMKLPAPITGKIIEFLLDPSKHEEIESFLKKLRVRYPQNQQLQAALKPAWEIYCTGEWFKRSQITLSQTPCSIAPPLLPYHNTTYLRRSLSQNMLSSDYVAEQRRYFDLSGLNWNHLPQAMTKEVCRFGKRYLIDQGFQLWDRVTATKVFDFSPSFKTWSPFQSQNELLVAHFQDEERFVWMGSQSGCVQGWDLSSFTQKYLFQCGGPVWFVDFSPGMLVLGYSIYHENDRVDRIQVLNPEDYGILHESDLGSYSHRAKLPLTHLQKSKHLLFFAYENSTLSLLHLKSFRKTLIQHPQKGRENISGMVGQGNVLGIGFGFKKIALFNIDMRQWITVLDFNKIRLNWNTTQSPPTSMASFEMTPFGLRHNQIIVSAVREGKRCIVMATYHENSEQSKSPPKKPPLKNYHTL